MTLPPLPEPKVYASDAFDAYTTEQLREYARAAIAAHVPEAAFGNIAAVPAQPVAWMDDFGNVFPLAANKGAGSWMDDHKRNWKPLYAAPQAVPVPAWQPIETAPRGSGEDGPKMVNDPDYVAPPQLLLMTPDGMTVGAYDWYYHAGYGRGAEPGVPAWRQSLSSEPIYDATHWQPLPAAPKEQPHE